MSTPIDTPAEVALTALAERFEHWRHTRANGRERIPKDLWDQAVALSTRLSDGQVAKRLRLSPTDLRKQRIARQSRSATMEAETPPAFVNIMPSNAVADHHAGRDRDRARAAGWGADVHSVSGAGHAVGHASAGASGEALMLQLTPQSRIFLAVEPIDFRAGIDRLAALCRERLEQNPLEGAVYVFRNRRGTALKLLL